MSNRNPPKPPVPVPEVVEAPPAPSDVVEQAPSAPPEPVQAAPVAQSKGAFSGIEVVALRSGFHRKFRRKEGDKFFVKSMDKVGDWMRCVDPRVEKEHQRMMAEKKKNLKLKKAED